MTSQKNDMPDGGEAKSPLVDTTLSSDPYFSLLSEAAWNAKSFVEHDVPDLQIRKMYHRARSIVRHSGITADDLLRLTPRFWEFMQSYVFTRDTAAFTILVIHWNLCLGTIAEFLTERPDLGPLARDLEAFNVCGMYMLTELDHGLDTRNIETRATLQNDGSFDLHTPHIGAAKSMPPNGFVSGVPRMAVVYARLFAEDRDLGIKMFIVPLNTHDAMCEGVSCRLLPKRTGARAVDHAITTFDHVRLPATALLGSVDKPKNARSDFFRQIWRIAVGSFALSVTNINALRLSAFIAAKFSQRRMVGAGDMNSEFRVPVISYSTSYRPILHAFALASVFEVFAQWAQPLLADTSINMMVRMGIAHTYKATVINATQPTLKELSLRCGWQGIFGFNQISELTSAEVGASIAEGDSLVVCIRLATELLVGRYSLPQPRNSRSLLARYEAGVWSEARSALTILAGGQHRGPGFNTHILPRCQDLIIATGQRMAYEAAAASASIAPEVLALFESICLRWDMAWFVENLQMTRAELLERDGKAADGVLPMLGQLMEDSGAQPWVTAPIVSEEKVVEFISGLRVLGGEVAKGHLGAKL